MSDTQRLRDSEAAAEHLHTHLTASLGRDGQYPETPSWGYAFSVLLSAAIGNGTLTPLGEAAREQLQQQASHHRNFSWEFVVYAVQQARRLLSPGAVLPYSEHRAKGTRMLNWFLLRQVNRGWFVGHAPRWTLLRLRIARRLYTREDGLLVDEFCTRSLQYHAFCLFLLCELADQHPEQAFLRDWLCEGVRCALACQLHDGSALWLGRGQEQIFGYGALMYAAEYTHRRVRELPEPALDALSRFVLSQQRSDGSFPLVLRIRQPEASCTRFEVHPPGWYGYNTLYDYQPFLGYLLWRTAQLGKAS